jgi:hypothetical protein
VRRQVLREISRDIASLSESEQDPDSAAVRRMMVERFGARCAGWLVHKHRRQLHASGAFDVEVPPRARDGKEYEIPMWFALATAFLRQRPGWSVDVRRQRRSRMFRIRWHAWHHQVPVVHVRRA